MKTALRRLRSLVVAEATLRLRTPATGVLFLFLCAGAYLLMPAAGGSHAMFLVEDRRVILNSAATALASGLMGSILLLFAGYYLTSSSIERDIRTGVGPLIASTPVASFTYLAGKYLGNVLYLGVVVTGYMVACMGMHLIRGEASLEPQVYGETYGILLVPLVFTIAAIALFFESIPVLSGRLGDVIYFIVALVLMSLPVATMATANGGGWVRYLDLTGMGTAVTEVTRLVHTSHFSIGWASYDPSLPPVSFPSLQWDADLLHPRIVSLLFVVPFMALALLAFHRFDPTRGKAVERSAQGRRPGLYVWSTRQLRRLMPVSALWPHGRPGLLHAAVLDVRLSVALVPVLLPLGVAALAVAILVPLQALRMGVLPILFAVLAATLAGVTTRDHAQNVTGLLHAAPHLRRHFALWKLLSLGMLALLLCGPFVVRMFFEGWHWGVAFAGGCVVCVATGFLLGLLSRSPRPFMFVFLLFLYLSISSKNVPGFDFAGLNGVATMVTVIAYGCVSAIMIAVALLWQGWRTRAT